MIGRKQEIDELVRMYESDESEFVAIYGRRRVGKTFLVRETFSENFCFLHTGLANGGMKSQLRNFYQSLQEYGCSGDSCPKDWMEAFGMLRKVISAAKMKRKVIFIDEMPWMDTPRSGFLMALEAFWNGWANARKDILLIICGSAASWITKNLFRNTGGLHNRVTCRICLMPFSLHDCELYALEKGVAMSRKDLAECYMVLGGIPYYWRYLDKRFSLSQNIDRMFFREDAPLAQEFSELFSSLFRKSTLFIKVAEKLASRKSGMSLTELATALRMTPSGKLTEILETLESSGFIRKFSAFGARRKNATFQLVDPFTLFHFQFLTGASHGDPKFWETTGLASKQAAWRGLSFERLCLLHINQIRETLGISGVHMGACTWRHSPDDFCPNGAQIALLLDRSDNVINLCEIKYCSDLFAIDKKVADEIAMKTGVFREVTGTRKSIHVTFITSGGLVHNSYWRGVQSEIKLDDSFRE